MTFTQYRAADDTDRDLYPAGKQRLTPLGILFFCAFMSSTMVSMIIESLSALTQSTAEGPEELLSRAYAEQALSDDFAPQVEKVIAELSGGSSHQGLVVLLLASCVLVKGACYIWCLMVTRVARSEISKTLGIDHWNDIISNFATILVVGVVQSLEAGGYESPWLSKIEPIATLLMSLWILWCWVDNAMEQVRLLSNRRVEDHEEVAKIRDAAQQHLNTTGLPLLLGKVDVYHCGESFEARLEVMPKNSAGSSLTAETLATVLHELEIAVCDGDVGVHKVHAKIKQQRSGDVGDASWVAGYTAP
jgi:divalent metal cation (Fe/Co/Zn/Cd) transporter